MEQYLVPLVSVACVVGGIWILKLSVGWRRKGTASTEWPSVRGKILSSKLHLANASRTSIGPDVSLRYEYAVGSEEYTNEKIAFYEVTTTDEANVLYERFPPGAEVDVFYNPANRKESVLVQGLRTEKQFHEFAMGVIVILVGLVLMFVHWEKFLALAAMLGVP